MLSSSHVACVNFFHRQEELYVSAAAAAATAAGAVGTAHTLVPSHFKDILKQTCRMLRHLLWTAES